MIVRGINRQNIVQDEDDKGIFLDRLIHYKDECRIRMYAFCLMSNHVHLLLAEMWRLLNEFMKKVGTNYSYLYNQKYDWVGHLFQDRYKSEPVNDDSYFLAVIIPVHLESTKSGTGGFQLDKLSIL